MNSLGASGSRGSKHGRGSGSAKHGNKDKEVYSGVGGGTGSEDASKDKTKLKTQSKGKGARREEDVRQAFAAMGRVREREPFMADESLIAAANDTTVVQGANSDDDCEITLEELAPKFPTAGQTFGHRGWIAGGNEEGEKEEEGDGAGEDSPIAVSSQEEKSRRNETKTKGAMLEQQTGKSPAKASKPVKSSEGSAGKAQRNKNPDPFALESELDDDEGQDDGGGGDETLPENRASSEEEKGARSGHESGVTSAGGQRGARTVKNSGRKLDDERKGMKVKQADCEARSQGESDQEPARPVSTRVKRAVHVPVLDEHVSRSEIKTGRRAEIRKKNELVRRQAGAEKSVQRNFDEVLDEIRMTNPLSVGNGEVLCWSRKLAQRACDAVHLTVATVAESSHEQVEAAKAEAVAWLEENKPKVKSCIARERLGTNGSASNTGQDGHNSSGVVPEQVEGDEDGGREDEENAHEGAGGPGGSKGGNGGKGEGEEPDDSCNSGKVKRQRTHEREGLPKQVGGRRERRADNQLQRRAQRDEERAKKRDEQEHIPPPKTVGRPKQAKELEEHKRATRKRERGRQAAKELVEEALKQQRRRKEGASLTADEQQLAEFAKTLSPTKVLGAGFRMAANPDDDIELSEDEDGIEELMEETGCEWEEAREALNLSCDWTANGKPSRVKAAKWLDSRRNEEERQDDEEKKDGSDSDCELVGHQSPGGTLTGQAGRAGGRAGAKALGLPGGRRGGADAGKSNAEAKSTGKLNRKAVPKDSSSKSEGSSSSEPGKSSQSDNSLQCSSSELGQSLDSSPASSDNDGESSISSQEEAGRKKRRDGSKTALSPRSQHRSRGDEARRATRYVRQLALALKIDSAWAREVYDQCVSEGTTTYDGLLRKFYRNECERAKGTQKETAKPLTVLGRAGAVGGGDINMTLPTFQLPEWGPGQPPTAGVHFTTLQRMLESYEKYDKQTNFMTQVTFKSMVALKLKPNVESKCKLPTTVWLPPVESDWMEVANGRPEKGGWSDMRFLRRLRKKLQPAGRTSYEIMFEKAKLRHKGNNDRQLEVALDLWGSNWLAQEREAEEQGKALPAQKMKLYFRKAVDGIPRFRRWLEGRKFVSCQDWYSVLCRKLHQSLGKAEEAAYDREMEGGGDADHGRGGGRNYGNDRAGDAGWQGGRGGGSTGSGDRGGRGGGAYRGGYGGRGSSGTTGTERPGNFRKFSEDGAGARGNVHTAGGTITPHSGGVEPMTTSGGRGGSSPRGGFRARGGSDRRTSFDGATSPRASRQPVNSGAEEVVTKLPKGARWHDSTMASCRCRDADCGVRQECLFCQGCGMHGHDRPYCYKAGEPRFNPTGYWCINRPNENPIEGLGTQRDSGSGVATARGNMMDAKHQ
jgi:hypothetical protein